MRPRRSTARAAPTTTMVLALPFKGGHQHVIDIGSKGVGVGVGVGAGDLILSAGMPILDNASGQRVGSGSV